ncbi:hypothetical protein DFP73DRAFT_377030 [Morchella snyderi]|nr:hypothetical protein DFP73DRAFT_377030 [Morchella snyderi]
MSATLRLLRRPLLRVPSLPTTTLPLRRHASTPPKVLAKPSKYTPPSHPSVTRPRDPLNYPGPPQPPRDPTRRYPNTMPPPNTLAHTLLTSRVLHFYISMGILITLAATVSIRNFLATSPFAANVRWEWMHPYESMRMFLVAVREHTEDQSRRVAEMRRRKVEDVELRGEFRKAHGLEKTGNEGGFGGWGVKKSGREPVAPAAQESKGDWVEEQIMRAEEEAAMLVEAAEREKAVATEKGEMEPETVIAAVETPAKKKGWW